MSRHLQVGDEHAVLGGGARLLPQLLLLLAVSLEGVEIDGEKGHDAVDQLDPAEYLEDAGPALQALGRLYNVQCTVHCTLYCTVCCLVLYCTLGFALYCTLICKLYHELTEHYYTPNCKLFSTVCTAHCIVNCTIYSLYIVLVMGAIDILKSRQLSSKLLAQKVGRVNGQEHYFSQKTFKVSCQVINRPGVAGAVLHTPP